MIKKIEVKGLFGTFNHPIQLKKENITLLLGENGLGKTIILKMIKSFFDSNFYELQSNLFKEFQLTFTDNSIVKITKVEKKEASELNIKMHTKARKTPYSHTITFDESNIRDRRKRRFEDNLYYREASFLLQRHLPFPIERMGGDRWFDNSRGIRFSSVVSSKPTLFKSSLLVFSLVRPSSSSKSEILDVCVILLTTLFG